MGGNPLGCLLVCVPSLFSSFFSIRHRVLTPVVRKLVRMIGHGRTRLGRFAQGFRRSWLHGFQSKVGPKLISESSSLRIPNGKECPFGLHVRSCLCSQCYDGCRRKTHRCLKRLFRTAMGFFQVTAICWGGEPNRCRSLGAT